MAASARVNESKPDGQVLCFPALRKRPEGPRIEVELGGDGACLYFHCALRDGGPGFAVELETDGTWLNFRSNRHPENQESLSPPRSA